jgi:hypothetical protein
MKCFSSAFPTSVLFETRAMFDLWNKFSRDMLLRRHGTQESPRTQCRFPLGCHISHLRSSGFETMCAHCHGLLPSAP